MRLLSCLAIAALVASPALADETAPVAQPEQMAEQHAEAQSAAPGTAPKKKRTLACPACAANPDPSFAIRPADQQASPSAVPPPAAGPTEIPGTAAAPPPVNFSFSGSGDGGRSSRYRGGVRVGTSF